MLPCCAAAGSSAGALVLVGSPEHFGGEVGEEAHAAVVQPRTAACSRGCPYCVSRVAPREREPHPEDRLARAGRKRVQVLELAGARWVGEARPHS
jgi:hypothetical protein